MRRILPLFLILALLPSCLFRVGPDFTPPPVSDQPCWTNQEGRQGGAVVECWWQQFNDPKLEELLGYAVSQNLTLKSALMRIAEARALLGISIGEFFPQTQELVGDATKIKVSKNAPNSISLDRKYWDIALGLSVSWELDLWGKFRRGIESAQELLLAEQADFDNVLVLLLSDVASTYVSIRTLDERIAILEYNVSLQERSLEIATARWQAGMVTELDVQQAQTLVSSTQARLPTLIADREAAKNTLAVLLGVTPYEITCYLPNPGKIPQPPAAIAAGLPCELLFRRPDIQRAFHAVASQSARIGVAYAELFPSISLTGFFGLNTAEATSSRTTGGNRVFFSADTLTYQYGGGFRWPILNYGRLINRVYAEMARFQQALFDYQNSALLAYQEVESSLAGYYNAQKRVLSLYASVKAATRSTELSRKQYIEGVADYTRVLNTEQALVGQEEDLAIARGEIAQNLIATYRALGGGWQPFFEPICKVFQPVFPPK